MSSQSPTRQITSANSPADSLVARNKALRATLKAKLLETQTQSQVVTDYGSGKTYIVRETV